MLGRCAPDTRDVKKHFLNVIDSCRIFVVTLGFKSSSLLKDMFKHPEALSNASYQFQEGLLGGFVGCQGLAKSAGKVFRAVMT